MNEEQQLFVNCLWGTENTTDIAGWVQNALVVYDAVKHFEVLTCYGEKAPDSGLKPEVKAQDTLTSTDKLENYLKNLKLEIYTKRAKE